MGQGDCGPDDPPYSRTALLKEGVGPKALVEVEGGTMLRCPLSPLVTGSTCRPDGSRKPADPLSKPILPGLC